MRPASENGWFSLARGDLCGRCHTCWGCRWKSQNRKIVPLSSYVEEPLNSKVIKSFKCKCFSCFEIPMFYLYGHSMYVSHIAISSYGTDVQTANKTIQLMQNLVILTKKEKEILEVKPKMNVSFSKARKTVGSFMGENMLLLHGAWIQSTKKMNTELLWRKGSSWNQMIGQSFMITWKKIHLAEFQQGQTQEVKNEEKSNVR